MTIWTPDLTPFEGPLYLKLVKAIEQAISTGILSPETRLPTHRALADKLGVTVGTVNRAYTWLLYTSPTPRDRSLWGVGGWGL